MIDYKAIADASVGYATYQDAFAVLSVAETGVVYGTVSPNKLKIWAATFPNDYQTLRNGTDTISQLAFGFIGSDALSLDTSDPMIQYFIANLPISAEGKAGIFTTAAVTTLKWPNLKEGHVQNAMHKRAEGVV